MLIEYLRVNQEYAYRNQRGYNHVKQMSAKEKSGMNKAFLFRKMYAFSLHIMYLYLAIVTQKDPNLRAFITKA